MFLRLRLGSLLLGAGSRTLRAPPQPPPAFSCRLLAASASAQGAPREPEERRRLPGAKGGQPARLAPASQSPPLRRASATRQKGGPVRLAKALAEAGVASRRGAEELVFAGRVRVNGAVVTVPQTLVTKGADLLEVDGSLVSAQPVRHFYFALHKPVGYLCTNAVQGEKLVLDLFGSWLERWKEHNKGKAELPPRLFTVGRMDVATSGLLLVTNDGAWAQRIAHPSSGVSKEYILTAATTPTKRQVATMAEGMVMEGAMVVPLCVERLASPIGGSSRRVLVEVVDGRNWEVRRLAEGAGLEVEALRRVRVGSLRLPSSLRAGLFKELTFREAKDVYDATLMSEARAGPPVEQPQEAAPGQPPPSSPREAS